MEDFDTRRLQAWLSGRLGGMAPLRSARRLAGGQSNPTYALTLDDGRRLVLRKKPAGALLPSAHAIEREYRVIAALHRSEVPVPRALCLCEDVDVVGTPFFVMEHVEGRVFLDPALPELAPADRAALYDDINRVVAALHRIDPAAVGLADYGKPGPFLRRQIDRWASQYRLAATDPIPEMDRLIEWLPAHLPETEETRLFHGDLRVDNLIVHPAEPRVTAVLDWELSTLGDPLADFAYHALPWRLGKDQFRGMAGTDYASLGIPDEASYLRDYCRRAGRAPVPPGIWEFYLAYSMFRLAAILQGILKRALDGNAASPEAFATGARARSIAQAAWQQAGSSIESR